MTTVERIIAKHSFTKEINPRFLHLFNECATFERFGVRHQLFQEGFAANRFYLIHSGSVALQTLVPGRGVTTIQTVGAGSALGWSWLYPPYLWGFTAVVVDPLEAVSLSAATLRERMEENHEFGYAVAMRVGQILLQYLQATRRRLVEAYDVSQ